MLEAGSELILVLFAIGAGGDEMALCYLICEFDQLMSGL